MMSTAHKDPLSTDECSQKTGTETARVAMFSVEHHEWGESVFQESGSARIDYCTRTGQTDQWVKHLLPPHRASTSLAISLVLSGNDVSADS